MLLAQNTFAEYSNTYTKCIQRQKQLGGPSFFSSTSTKHV